ncbi:MAG: hypothetical protein AABY36_08030 [Campylobacterota bacterium]
MTNIAAMLLLLFPTKCFIKTASVRCSTLRIGFAPLVSPETKLIEEAAS